MLLYSKLLTDAGFAHAFPGRDVADAELFACLGASPIVQVTQVHGGRVVDAGDAPGAQADAIVAFPRDGGPVAVGVRVADCVPILLADPRTGAVAAVHAGWRGVVAHVIRGAVARLGGGALLAAVGPCIGPCCFEVGADVAREIALACGDPGVIVRTSGEKAYVDLRAAARTELRASRLAPGAIDDVAGCTKHEAHFHSYRRDGADSGRMLAAIATRAAAVLARA